MGPDERIASLELLINSSTLDHERMFFSQLARTRQATLRKERELKAAVGKAIADVTSLAASSGPGGSAIATSAAPLTVTLEAAEAALDAAVLALKVGITGSNDTSIPPDRIEAVKLASVLLKLSAARSSDALDGTSAGLVFASLFMRGSSKSPSITSVDCELRKLTTLSRELAFNVSITAEFRGKRLAEDVAECGAASPMMTPYILTAQKLEAEALQAEIEGLLRDLKEIAFQRQRKATETTKAEVAAFRKRHSKLVHRIRQALRTWSWVRAYLPEQGKVGEGWDQTVAQTVEGCLASPPSLPWRSGSVSVMVPVLAPAAASAGAGAAGAATAPLMSMLSVRVDQSLAREYHNAKEELERTKEELVYLLENDIVRSLRFCWVYVAEIKRVLSNLSAEQDSVLAALRAENDRVADFEFPGEPGPVPPAVASAAGELRLLRGRRFLILARLNEVWLRLGQGVAAMENWNGAGKPHALHACHLAAVVAAREAKMAEAAAASAEASAVAPPQAEGAAHAGGAWVDPTASGGPPPVPAPGILHAQQLRAVALQKRLAAEAAAEAAGTAVLAKVAVVPPLWEPASSTATAGLRGLAVAMEAMSLAAASSPPAAFGEAAAGAHDIDAPSGEPSGGAEVGGTLGASGGGSVESRSSASESQSGSLMQDSQPDGESEGNGEEDASGESDFDFESGDDESTLRRALGAPPEYDSDSSGDSAE